VQPEQKLGETKGVVPDPDVKKSQQLIEELQREVSRLEEENRTAFARADAAETKVEEQQTELSDWQKRWNMDHDEKMTDATDQSRMTPSQSSTEQLEQQVSMLTSRRDSLVEEIISQHETLSSLEDRMTKIWNSTAQEINMESQLNLANRRAEELQRQLDEIQADKGVATGSQSPEVQKISSLTSAADAATAADVAAAATLAAEEKRLQQLEEYLVQERHQLSVDMSELQSMREALTADRNKLTEDRKKLESDTVELELKRAELKAAQDLLASSADDTEAERDPSRSITRHTTRSSTRKSMWGKVTRFPRRLALHSKYANLSGIFVEILDAGLEKPIFKREDGLLLVSQGDKWFLKDSLDAKTAWTRVKDAAPDPTYIKAVWEDRAVTQIKQTRTMQSNSDRILIKAGGSDITGVYVQQDVKCEGRPVFKHTDSMLHLLSRGAAWVLTNGLKATGAFDRNMDVADHPAGILQAWDEGQIKSIEELMPPEPLEDCPNSLAVDLYHGSGEDRSVIQNLSGGFRRIDDVHDCPAYYEAEKGIYIWRDVAATAWVFADSCPPCQSEFLRITTASIDPRLMDDHFADNQDVQIEIQEVTWAEEDLQAEFVDEAFPPNDSSLGVSAPHNEWIRAADLNRDLPDSLFEGIQRHDTLSQGRLGDCWLISALTCLAQYPHRIKHAFGETEQASEDGRYELQLWDFRTGEWTKIVIDDMIPCEERPWYQRSAVPLFVKPSKIQGIWAVLIEKAFAKFLGTYGALAGGSANWAWQALLGTNEVVELVRADGGKVWKLYELNEEQQKQEWVEEQKRCTMGWVRDESHPEFEPHELFDFLKKSLDSKRLMCTSISSSDPSVKEFQRDDGLVEGHSYSLLDAQILPTEQRLVQLRNPWANEREWNGDWSDKSDKWKEFEGSLKFVGHRAAADGVFWMDICDFATIFSSIDVCMLPMS